MKDNNDDIVLKNLNHKINRKGAIEENYISILEMYNEEESWLGREAIEEDLIREEIFFEETLTASVGEIVSRTPEIAEERFWNGR